MEKREMQKKLQELIAQCNESFDSSDSFLDSDSHVGSLNNGSFSSVSDISMVDSFQLQKLAEEARKETKHLLNNIKEKKEKVSSTSKTDQKKQKTIRKSKIPVRGDGFSTSSSNKYGRIHTPSKIRSSAAKSTNSASNNNTSPTSKMSANDNDQNEINYYISNDEKPINFLAPDLTVYSNLTICIFEGNEFPRRQYGERSTNVLLQFPTIKDQNIKVETNIVFNKTQNVQYNTGHTFEITGLDFNKEIPKLLVFDNHEQIQDKQIQKELIGIGYIQLQSSKKENDICVTLRDEWISVYSPIKGTECGKIRMTMIFHNGKQLDELQIKRPEPIVVQQQTQITQDLPSIYKTPQHVIQQPINVIPFDIISEAPSKQPKIQGIKLNDDIGENDDSLLNSSSFRLSNTEKKRAWQTTEWTQELSNQHRKEEDDDKPIYQEVKPVYIPPVRQPVEITQAALQYQSTNYQKLNMKQKEEEKMKFVDTDILEDSVALDNIPIKQTNTMLDRNCVNLYNNNYNYANNDSTSFNYNNNNGDTETLSELNISSVENQSSDTQPKKSSFIKRSELTSKKEKSLQQTPATKQYTKFADFGWN